MTTEVVKLVLKRGSTSRAAAYTGPEGEVVVDTGLDTLRIQDGVTPGGVLLSKEGHGHGISDVSGLSTVLGSKAPLDSPAFAGIPTAPTAAPGTTSKQLATTEFVAAALASSIAGNASTASKLAVARTISLSGDASGAVAFDGSANVTLSVSVADNSHNHSFSNITGLPTTLAGYGIADAQPKDADLTAIAALTSYGMIVRTGGGTAATRSLAVSGNGLSVANADGLGGSPTVVSNAVSANQPSTLVFRDASGNFSAGTVTAALAGNAATASRLQSARQLNFGGDVVGSSSFDGSANANVGLSLVETGVFAGTYTSVSVDIKGRVTAGYNPTTLAGYGITDAAPIDSPALTGTPTVPTPAPGTVSKQAVNAEYLASEIAAARLTGGSVDGSPVGASAPSTGRFTTLSTVGDVTIGGNLVVNGMSYVANSTVVTVQDPIITLGGETAPLLNDGKDRGVEFRWHDGTAAKVGFFGFDRSTGRMTFVPDAVNTGEIFSGAPGVIEAGLLGDVTGNAATASRLLTGRTVSLTGDLSGTALFDGSANLALAATLPDTGVTPGIYGSQSRTLVAQVDSKGRVVGLTSLPSTPSFGNLTDRPTTLLGYGITDAAPINSPAFTGVPTVPTASPGTRSGQVASTQFVTDAVQLAQSATVITGGTINSTPIGASSASTGRFTTVATLGDTNVGGNAIVTGALFVNQSASMRSASITGDVSIGGNLTVLGTTTTVNSTTVTVSDPVITLGGEFAPSVNDGKDRGVEFRWHDDSSAKVGFFGFDADTQQFVFIPDASNGGEVFSGQAGTIRSNLTGNVVGNVTGSLTGNASTASRLATPRSISVSGDAAGATSFDGSADANISLTLADSGVTAGSYTGVTVDAKGRVVSGHNPTTLAGYGITDAAPINSPAFTGIPTAPTPLPDAEGEELVTAEFVKRAIANATNTIDGGTF